MCSYVYGCCGTPVAVCVFILLGKIHEKVSEQERNIFHKKIKEAGMRLQKRTRIIQIGILHDEV